MHVSSSGPYSVPITYGLSEVIAYSFLQPQVGECLILIANGIKSLVMREMLRQRKSNM